MKSGNLRKPPEKLKKIVDFGTKTLVKLKDSSTRKRSLEVTLQPLQEHPVNPFIPYKSRIEFHRYLIFCISKYYLDLKTKHSNLVICLCHMLMMPMEQCGVKTAKLRILSQHSSINSKWF